MELSVGAAKAIRGELRPPSDKSLTHRAYMFGAIADRESIVQSPLLGEDCESTLRCLIHLGLRHEPIGDGAIRLIPTESWMEPSIPLDCGNSGTTMRLLSGLLASRRLRTCLTGDASLSRRPMKRIAVPLELMGATVKGEHPPLTIQGGQLAGIDYLSPVASAQVKSCVLLAGLRATGTTSVTEPSLSRDHTERMLAATGVHLVREGTKTSVEGGQRPHGFEMTIPADISSAAFFVVAASMLANSHLLINDLGVNPSRTGLLDVLTQVGVNWEIRDERSELGEPTANLAISPPDLRRPFSIDAGLVPRLIDEIPVLAVLATQCEGTSVVNGAHEMRVKETDRIEQVATGLRRMGASVETFEDGFAITGPTPLTGVTIDAAGDHRIGMTFAIAGLIASGETTIINAESIFTSYPTFADDLRRLSNG